jgi:hypothetical protein
MLQKVLMDWELSPSRKVGFYWFAGFFALRLYLW